MAVDQSDADEGQDTGEMTRLFMSQYKPVEQSAGGMLSSTERRLQNERRAAMTPKQRAKRAKKPSTVNFRCSDSTRRAVELLAEKYGSNYSDVMERAVKVLAEKEKIRLGAE